MVATATITITVDDEDADLLQYSSKLRNSQIRIAQVIATRNLGPKPKGYHVDHIDNDWTNNRRSNLTYITAAENMSKTRRTYPKKIAKRRTTRGRLGYYGVSAVYYNSKKSGKYISGYTAQVAHDNILYSKTVTDLETAARIYDSLVVQLGLDRELNFPIIDMYHVDMETISKVRINKKKTKQSVEIGGVKYPTRRDAAIALGVTRQRIAQIVANPDYAAKYKTLPVYKCFKRNGKRRLTRIINR